MERILKSVITHTFFFFRWRNTCRTWRIRFPEVDCDTMNSEYHFCHVDSTTVSYNCSEVTHAVLQNFIQHRWARVIKVGHIVHEFNISIGKPDYMIIFLNGTVQRWVLLLLVIFHFMFVQQMAKSGFSQNTDARFSHSAHAKTTFWPHLFVARLFDTNC